MDANPTQRLVETAGFLEARGITKAEGTNPIWFNGALVGEGPSALAALGQYTLFFEMQRIQARASRMGLGFRV